MHRLHMEVSIAFRSRFHCGSGEGGLEADRLLRRDCRGRPFVPASTLKGVVRESCEKLCRTLGFPDPSDPHATRLTHPGIFEPLSRVKSPVECLFGNRREEGGLVFRDARPEGRRGPVSAVRSRIRMNRVLGTARDKFLFTTEYASAGGEGAGAFRTSIDGRLRDWRWAEEGTPPLVACLLAGGLLCVERLGGDKSTGAGRVAVSVDSALCDGEAVSVEDLMEYLQIYGEMVEDFFGEGAEGGRA